MYLLTRNSSSSFLCKHKPRLPSKNKPITTPTVYDFLLHKHHFSPEAAKDLASAIPHFPEKSNSLLSFLKKNDFSNSHLERILKYNPIFIWADLEKSVQPKIKILQQLGLPNNNIADLCKANPSIFHRNVNTSMLPAISVLRGLLGSDDNVVKLLIKSGLFLTVELDKCLVPNIECLNSRSVPMNQIIRAVSSSERFILQKPENMRRRAEKAEELGVKPGSRMYIYAVKVIASMSYEAWELKLEAFRSLGFSEDDILNAFSKCPTAFAVSVKRCGKLRMFWFPPKSMM